MKGDLFMKRKVLVSMGMCLMLFFSFATMTQAGYVNFDVTVAANEIIQIHYLHVCKKRIRKTGIMLHQQVLVILEKYEDFQKH